MAIDITAEDLLLFCPELSKNQAEIMVKNAIAVASFHAPCLAEDTITEQQASVAYAVILDALRRWADSGSGALSAETQQVGPFGQTLSYDTRSGIRTGYYQSEINMLKQICEGRRKKRPNAWSVDTIGDRPQRCPVSDCEYLWGSVGSECEDCGLTQNPEIYGR